MEQMDQQLAHAAERVDFVLALAGAGQFVQRLVQGVEQRLEQIGFVTEMPIDGPACHPRSPGDITQARRRHALLTKQAQSLHHDGAAGLLCFFFGSTSHTGIPPG